MGNSLSKPRVILITGPPRSGKTTLVMRLLEKLPAVKTAGFYTEEIRERRERKGFKLISLSGASGVLSHVDFKSSRRVGKYRVDVEGFEKFLSGISFAADIAVVDEIGKMEVMSPRFRELIEELIASDKTLIATIGLKGDAFVEGLKKTPGARLFTISKENRDEALEDSGAAWGIGRMATTSFREDP
jgi:nucleoside-triphosphatase